MRLSFSHQDLQTLGEALLPASPKAHPSLITADGVLKRCEQEDISILLPTMPAWPQRFAHLGKHAPRVLFLRGVLPPLPHIAIIGTRIPSAYGTRVTQQLLGELRGSGIAVASGLALGIDGFAHTYALEHTLPTTAVLGLGVTDEQVYPKQHTRLAERILNAGGCLLSEVAPGATTHFRGAFPLRNRLLAALCHALVVVEARERSGTLITARVALELGRDVLAVPGSIFSPQSNGTHTLLASGASVCTSAKDIWTSVRLDAPKVHEQAHQSLHTNPTDQPLIELLRSESDGATLDQCVAALGVADQEASARLGLLELQGLIRQLPNGRWILAGLAY